MINVGHNRDLYFNSKNILSPDGAVVAYTSNPKGVFFMNEEWRTIWNFPSYAVSNIGRVKRIEKYRNSTEDGVLKFSYCGGKCDFGGKYLAVCLCQSNVKTTRTVHSLVARQFIGVRPEGYHINHIDGDRYNNKVENLEYVTPLENIKHQVRIGHTAHGVKNNCAKLDDEKVKLMRDMHRILHYPYRSLASIFKVSIYTAIRIVRHESWVRVK